MIPPFISTTASPADNFSAEAISVRYAKEHPNILADLSLTIPSGKITVLIGANGSGKSTLLKSFGRQLLPHVGRIMLNNKDLAILPRLEMAGSIGILFQENAAPNGLTVEELVAYGRFPYRRLFESPTEDDFIAIENALTRTGLLDFRHRLVDQLSGGQKQLAWIALALTQTTRVLLLDEPTTFLDLKHQIEVMHVVESLRSDLGLTIIMVLHDVNQAARHADHLIAMRDGKIIAQGPPATTITPDLLRDVYEVDAEVLFASDGLPVCVVRHPLPNTEI